MIKDIVYVFNSFTQPPPYIHPTFTQPPPYSMWTLLLDGHDVTIAFSFVLSLLWPLDSSVTSGTLKQPITVTSLWSKASTNYHTHPHSV